MHPEGSKRGEGKKLLIFIPNAVAKDEIKKSRHREAPFKKRMCALHLLVCKQGLSQGSLITGINDAPRLWSC